MRGYKKLNNLFLTKQHKHNTAQSGKQYQQSYEYKTMSTKNLIMGIVSCSLLLSLSSCQHRTLPTGESAVSFPQNVEILLPTQYRKESMGYPKDVQEKEWYEIYKDAKTGRWHIGQAELETTYGHDECVGEDVMIIKSKHEEAVLFFVAFEGLSEHLVTVLEDKMLFPEHDLSFSFEGKEYHLSAVGSCLGANGQIMTTNELKSKTNEDLDNNTRILGYRLSFGNDGSSIELATIENIDYATPRLIWAGDLNNDGLPDLILNLPDFYESQHLYFFLSDKKDKEKPLKKAADLLMVNDC